MLHYDDLVTDLTYTAPPPAPRCTPILPFNVREYVRRCVYRPPPPKRPRGRPKGSGLMDPALKKRPIDYYCHHPLTLAPRAEHPVLSPYCRRTYGAARHLAHALKVTECALSLWVRGKRPVPPARCYQIETATHGQLRCEQLRPDLVWSRKETANDVHA